MAGSAPIRLHIGGNDEKAGWTILNIQEGPHVDLVGDCRNLSAIQDNSVAEIYASHVFEHLGYLDELPTALAECHRVLAPRGLLRISVPDFEVLCRVFLQPQLNMEQRYTVMRIVFGGQTDPYDYHKAGMTFEFLTDYLLVAGFAQIERVDGHGLFQDSSTLDLGGIPISLNVVACKP